MKQYRNILLILSAAIVMASCSTEEAVITAPEDVIERIDMVLEGDNTEYIYKKSEQEDATEDLVNYNFYGNPSHKIDFHVNLDNFRTLVFKVVNENIWNPWESEESYSLYASQDLEDKQKYVTVEMLAGGEVATYMSNTGYYPQGTYLNTFSIVSYDPANNEILCRIVDLPLVSATDPGNNAITVNGTFRGSLSFLE